MSKLDFCHITWCACFNVDLDFGGMKKLKPTYLMGEYTTLTIIYVCVGQCRCLYLCIHLYIAFATYHNIGQGVPAMSDQRSSKTLVFIAWPTLILCCCGGFYFILFILLKKKKRLFHFVFLLNQNKQSM